MDSDHSNVKSTIEKSYDLIASHYLTWTTANLSPRTHYITKLLTQISSSSRLQILELGCGAGIPCTQLLAQRGNVIGVDISTAQIELAKTNVPSGAEFIRSDMMELDFEAERFDAVVAMYSLIHLPREEQEVLIKRAYKWVKPGGWFLGNFGTKDNPGSWNEDWLGERMWWSGWDEEGNKGVVERAGWKIIEGSVIVEKEKTGEEEAKSVPFLWVLGQRNEWRNTSETVRKRSII